MVTKKQHNINFRQEDNLTSSLPSEKSHTACSIYSLRILFLIFEAAAEVCLEDFKDAMVLSGNITRFT